MSFKLPPLPYGLKDLVPHLSEETLTYHYTKHHAGYVNKLNGLVNGTALENKSLEDIVCNNYLYVLDLLKTESGAVFNNAAQVWNHTFYWHSMSPSGGGEPRGTVRKLLDEKFGSFDNFKKEFSSVLVGHFGSGWGWLVLKSDGTPEVVQTHDAGNPLRYIYGICCSDNTGTPLLACDVWEHAYYVDYRNDRASYVNGTPCFHSFPQRIL
ncbi:Fe/Mn superoxide dismutase (SOD), putative [Theileria annulata]|uniref:Superoxide dismutase n=1 Tax=Theileria annulata TaxID=5874 RepID=Q4UIZ9_THEAN|nr:Fe/Mn superoxide dismutase (SOD), putative [Theileria annulata]CAI72940.1 Fe/Mn superoxide dismutase (SOD), putative [Theileria annulata]|eukprot:XP_953618.1 Fe/Mn superoxide dismutase (SOD), putative [Theileria annulata]